MASALNEAMVELAAVCADSLRGIVDAGKDELSAVGVTANLEIDPRFGVVGEDFRYVWVMREENARDFRINAAKCPLQVYFVFPKIANAADGEEVSISFEHVVLVVYESNSGMSVDLVGGVNLPYLVIVVAEHAEDSVGRIE